MAVTETWTDPVANHDLSAGQRVSETVWDQIMSNILYADRRVEPPLTNKSGSSGSAGTVVVMDTGNDSAFSVTALERYVTTEIGVIVDTTIANNAAGRVGFVGPCTINVQGNVAKGDYLITSTTSGRAKSDGATKKPGSFAFALTAYSGGGAGSVTALMLGRTPAGVVIPIRKAADESVTSSTTLQNDDELKIPVNANEVWTCEVTLYVTCSNAGGFKAAVTVPAGATLLVVCVSGFTTASMTFVAASGSTFVATNGGGGNPMFLKATVTVLNGATAGDIQLQWAQFSSDGTATIVKAGSSLVGHLK